MTRSAQWTATLLALLASASGAAAPEVSGSVRAAWYSQAAQFDERDDVAATALWLRTAPQLAENASLVLEGWVRNDASGDGGRTQARVREAYLDLAGEAWDLRLGQQLVIWGRADRLNPTDNVTPRDYTLLTPEDVDQRRGVQAARLRYRAGGAAVSAWWLPEFRPSTVPLAQLPGIRWQPQRPHARQGALRLDRTGGAVDWSLSYLNALDVNPDLKVTGAGAQGLDIALTHHRVRVLGADAATVAGRYGLRFEVAHTRTSSRSDPFIKKPFVFLVAGADRTFGEHLNVNLQYYARRVESWRDPRQAGDAALRPVIVQGAVASGQLERFQHGMTFRVADKWWNETLEGELAGVVSFKQREWAFKPRLTYAVSDHWRATAGMNWYRGQADTFFNYLAPTSSAFIEARYSF